MEGTVVLADVGVGQLIWAMLFLFMLAAFVWVFVLALRVLFHDDLPGWAKAIWLVALIVFPLFGSLIYLLVRGGWLSEGSAAQSAARARMSRTEFERHSTAQQSSDG
jgi:hypothetical protein